MISSHDEQTIETTPSAFRWQRPHRLCHPLIQLDRYPDAKNPTTLMDWSSPRAGKGRASQTGLHRGQRPRSPCQSRRRLSCGRGARFCWRALRGARGLSTMWRRPWSRCWTGGMTPAEALALRHAANRNGATELEAETAAADLAPQLEALGHECEDSGFNSGLHAIGLRTAQEVIGAADLSHALLGRLPQ